MCDIAAGRNMSTPMTNMVIEPLTKHSNFIQKCPYKIGNISINNLPVDIFKYPPFMPAGDYRINLRIFNEHNLTILLYKVFGTIVPKGLDQLLVG